MLLDEPVNGLDPEGIRWVRGLLRGLAAEGRTVLLSSHLMSEMALTADHLIIIGRGRLIADLSLDEFVHRHSTHIVHVRSPEATRLAALLSGEGVRIDALEPGLLEVEGLSAPQIGETAASDGIVLHALTVQQVSLEEAFMALTAGEVEYRAAGPDEAATARERMAA